MTPAQHCAQAESLLTAITNQPGTRIGASDADFNIIAAHTQLALAAGAGAHYTAAEAAIAKANPDVHVIHFEQSRVALAHAQLADR